MSKVNVPKNKATVGTINPNAFSKINPAVTPVSAYIKKTK